MCEKKSNQSFLVTGLILFLLFMTLTVQAKTRQGLIVGEVTDAATGEPIPFATVQVVGSNRSTLTNENGSYRLYLEPGDYDLKVTHVAYKSQDKAIKVGIERSELSFTLEPTLIVLRGTRVYDKAYDPAQAIIIEAINRKKDFLKSVHDYQFQAYVKLVVKDLTAPKDDDNIFLIAETQVNSFWEQPDKYKEIITARRQSANFPASGNLFSVGEILDFYKERIDFGDYAVVAPIANDALDFYNFYLLDTLEVDGRKVFRLEIEPKNQIDPLVTGYIHIADSTYDILLIDVGFNDAVKFPFIHNMKYSQEFVRLNNNYWMPVKIVFYGEVKFDIPLPQIPEELSFRHVASLYNFEFDTYQKKESFDDYELVVDEDADDYDSTTWYAKQTIPLLEEEVTAYDRIDSVENQPKTVAEQIVSGTIGIGLYSFFTSMFGIENGFFHFNRVDGTYLGYALNSDKLLSNTTLWGSLGYAFKREEWYHRYGAEYRLSKKHQWYFGGEYQYRVTKSTNVVNPGYYNPTFLALTYKIDPFNYHFQEGYRFYTTFKPVRFSNLTLGFKDYRQVSAEVTTDYSLFDREDSVRTNPAIAPGRMRSVFASLEIDTRKRWYNKGVEEKGFSPQYSTLTLGVEYASPDFIDNDFHFKRYTADFYTRRHLFGLGITSVRMFGGVAEHDLPPQRYFTVDFNDWALNPETGFNTLNETNFYGDRVFLIKLNHDFGRILFGKSGVSFLQKIPFKFSIFAGAFWTEFKETGYMDKAMSKFDRAEPYSFYAEKPYREIGFGLSNLTPFLNPFNLAVVFAWQLSDYDTNRFAFNFGFEM